MKNGLYLFFCLLFLSACNSNDDITPQLNENPSLRVVTVVEFPENDNDYLGVDDIITFTISIENDGDVILSNLSISASLTNIDNDDLNLTSNPNFTNADAGSLEGDLQIGETATYQASYKITQNDVEVGGILFSVIASGTSPEGENVNDQSDNGDDNDDNTVNDPTLITLTPPPIDNTIITECHFLDSDGNPKDKLYFDSEGQLYKIFYTDPRTTPNMQYIFNFDFNSDLQLTNLTKTDTNEVVLESLDFIYDSENRIQSIGDRNFEYVNDGTEYLIETETYYEDIQTYGDYEFTERTFTKYSIPSNNSIVSECHYFYYSEYNTVTEELDEGDYCLDFIVNSYNGNIQNECTDIDCIDFEHDNNPNPLKTATNLNQVIGFIRNTFTGNYDYFFFLVSQNNVTRINYSDPSEIIFSYTLNDNNLPVSSTRQYIDELGPGVERPLANYYYQGDEIPE